MRGARFNCFMRGARFRGKSEVHEMTSMLEHARSASSAQAPARGTLRRTPVTHFIQFYLQAITQLLHFVALKITVN
jgi:hypothetical protein